MHQVSGVLKKETALDVIRSKVAPLYIPNEEDCMKIDDTKALEEFIARSSAFAPEMIDCYLSQIELGYSYIIYFVNLLSCL